MHSLLGSMMCSHHTKVISETWHSIGYIPLLRFQVGSDANAILQLLCVRAGTSLLRVCVFAL